MRAILIDPVRRTADEVEYSGVYTDIKRLIEVGVFTTVMVQGRHAIYLDDEGLLKPEPGPFFTWAGYPQPLAGKGLIVQISPQGDDRPCQFPLPFVKLQVGFPRVRFVGLREESGEVDHPIFGKVFQISRIAQFEDLP